MRLISKLKSAWRFAVSEFASGGVVGLAYAVELAYLRRRIMHVGELLTRERDLHRDHLRSLNYELTQLVEAQQRASIEAALFWNHCRKQSERQS